MEKLKRVNLRVEDVPYYRDSFLVNDQMYLLLLDSKQLGYFVANIWFVLLDGVRMHAHLRFVNMQHRLWND